MSSRTMMINGQADIGKTNDDRQILVGPRSAYHEDKLAFTPPSVNGNGEVTKVDFFLSPNENKLIEDVIWEVGVTNSSATDTVAFNSLLYFLDQFKLTINNVLVYDLKEYEEIVNTVNNYYLKLKSDNRIKITWGVNNSSSTLDFTRITVAPLTTTTFYLSLLPLCEMLYMKNSTNVPKITVQLKFKTDTNAVVDISRFVTNLTSNTNPYTLLSFNNMNLQINSRSFSSAVMFSVAKALYPIVRYETNVQTLNLSSANQTWRLTLSAAFSKHKLITSVLFYAVDLTQYSAYNAVNNMKILNTFTAFNLTVKKRGKDYQYLDNVARKLYNLEKFIGCVGDDDCLQIDPLVNAATTNPYTTTLTWVNQVSFRSVQKHTQNVDVIEGVSNNESNEYELVFSNPSAISNNVNFFCIAQYVEFVKIDATGSVSKWME